MAAYTPPPADRFETEACSRCGGSGHHSYCSMYGTTCFQCRGRKNVYSKRGNAALAYARKFREVPASEVPVGWLLWVDASPLGGAKAGWYTVDAITHQEHAYGRTDPATGVTEWFPGVSFETKACGYGFSLDSKVQAVPNRERLAEVKALALAYQATLGMTGKVMKRAPRNVAPADAWLWRVA